MLGSDQPSTSADQQGSTVNVCCGQVACLFIRSGLPPALAEGRDQDLDLLPNLGLRGVSQTQELMHAHV